MVLCSFEIWNFFLAHLVILHYLPKDLDLMLKDKSGVDVIADKIQHKTAVNFVSNCCYYFSTSLYAIMYSNQ